MKLYRYTTKGEGVFSAGKRLLPEILVAEILEAKKWLLKPTLSSGNYRFYLTEKGAKMYEKTLLNSHKKYLQEIKKEIVDSSKIKKIIYEDEYQVVENLD